MLQWNIERVIFLSTLRTIFMRDKYLCITICTSPRFVLYMWHVIFPSDNEYLPTLHFRLRYASADRSADRSIAITILPIYFTCCTELQMESGAVVLVQAGRSVHQDRVRRLSGNIPNEQDKILSAMAPYRFVYSPWRVIRH
jgi:hypothetical protein